MTYNDLAKKYLSPPDYERFIYNMEHGGYKFINPDLECERIEYFIGCAFLWMRTPEGILYWKKINNNLRKTMGVEEL